ncbi:hypothetical protein ACET81_20630 [Aeromonas veronii]|uniref:hypothetical protein n=1 Tax=Aeromonas hydrophila TaxID=644 RepID=UPI001C5B84BE|nr:hypothetical protein [Aeromonas hydrophila]MBW3834698.1 hypothetical protein [Aeromonas hydrophila]MBW5280328.1 hypothetical protein [Aeromonas hydrophila]
MSDQHLRQELAALIARHGLSHAKVAELICSHADKSCAVRTVKAWLTDPDKRSARPCKEWALIALRRGLGYPDPEKPTR